MGDRKISAADRKAMALEDFRSALERGDMANNWREVAEALAACLPPPRVVTAEEPEDERYLPWADYAVPNIRKIVWPSPRITVMFADGEVVYCPAVTVEGKPINIGRGVRVAIAFYRNRMLGRLERAAQIDRVTWEFGQPRAYVPSAGEEIDVPAIELVTMREGGEEWNPDIANAETVELRKGRVAPTRAYVAPAMDSLAEAAESLVAVMEEAFEAAAHADLPSPAPTERQIAARRIYRVALGSTAIPMRRAA